LRLQGLPKPQEGRPRAWHVRRASGTARESEDPQKKAKRSLTYSYIGMYCGAMARAAATLDAFNAVADPRRRDILSFLALEERPVGDIVDGLGIEQPSVSKHLKVLREVGLVEGRRDGRKIFYRTRPEAIRPLQEWTQAFERIWTHQLARIKEQAEAKTGKQ
jgi:DNA-binding transcriptional ArsR family regulator